MTTNEQIIATVTEAMAVVDGNWADALDVALGAIGVQVDESASRDAGEYGALAVLRDGREIYRAEDTGEITISGTAHTCCDRAD